MKIIGNNDNDDNNNCNYNIINGNDDNNKTAKTITMTITVIMMETLPVVGAHLSNTVQTSVTGHVVTWTNTLKQVLLNTLDQGNVYETSIAQ